MNNIKIRSTKAVVPTSTNGTCYVSREVTSLNFDFNGKKVVPIMLEQLFKEQDFVNDNGDTITERLVIENKYRNFASKPLSENKVSELFSYLGNDILASENYMSKLRTLIDSYLIIDTTDAMNGNANVMFDLLPSEWVKDTPHVLVSKFTENE